MAYSHYPRADEGNNSVFESFSILSVLVFIEVFAIIFCLLFLQSTKPEIKILANTMAREGILKGDVIDKDKDKNNNETARLEKWTSKVMHGQYRRQITEIADPSSWHWLKYQDLKKRNREPDHCSPRPSHSNKLHKTPSR